MGLFYSMHGVEEREVCPDKCLADTSAYDEKGLLLQAVTIFR